MANYTPTPLDYGEFTSLPLFSDVVRQIREDDWTDQEIAEYVRLLIGYVMDGEIPKSRSYASAVFKSNLSSLRSSLNRQVANKRRRTKAGDGEPTPDDGKPYGQPYGQPTQDNGEPYGQPYGQPTSPDGLPNRMEWNENQNGNENSNVNKNAASSGKQQPELSLVKEEPTNAYPQRKRPAPPIPAELQKSAVDSYAEKNGLGYLQKAVGAAAFEDMVRTREYNPFEAEVEEVEEEQRRYDASFDVEADKKYDASITTPSTILPCMSGTQLNQKNGNLWMYGDAENQRHITPLGAILSNYHQRTGNTDYSSFQRSIKVNCPANCQGTQKQVNSCYDCINKALKVWDKTKSPTPHKIIAKIIQDERGF